MKTETIMWIVAIVILIIMVIVFAWMWYASKKALAAAKPSIAEGGL